MGGMPWLFPDDPNDPSPAVPNSAPVRIEPNPQTSQPAVPSYAPNLEAQARAAYGSNWDADAAQQFAYRQSLGQSPEDILRRTAEDAQARYNGPREQAARGESGGGGSARPNSAPQFSDASQRLLEDHALGRYQQLMNPNATSGTAMFEDYARQLFDTLQQPVYSASDEAVLKTKAFDALARERDSTKQRWMQELSRRGIQPSSGVALDGIRKIDEHFETLRTSSEADFARDAIAQTRAQRFQALGTAGQLAGSEEGRMDKAGTYAAVPYGLSQDAFARNLSLVNAGGSPSQVLSSALSLLANGQAQNYQQSQQRSAMTEGLLQYLGYLM